MFNKLRRFAQALFRMTIVEKVLVATTVLFLLVMTVSAWYNWQRFVDALSRPITRGDLFACWTYYCFININRLQKNK